jgi:hypothetical protein
MAVAYMDKQLVGSGTISSYTNLYATDGSHTAVISSIIICNESTSAITVRIGLSPTNGTTAPATGRFLAYDLNIAANETYPLPLGLAMGNTKYLNCSSSNAAVSFTANVAEIS